MTAATFDAMAYKPRSLALLLCGSLMADLAAVHTAAENALEELLDGLEQHADPAVTKYRVTQLRDLQTCATHLRNMAGDALIDHEDIERPWEQAVANYQAARDISETTSTDHLLADARVEARCAARDKLIEDNPAPNGPALAYKMRLVFEYSADFAGLLRNWEQVLLADAERLGGAA